MEKYTFTEMQFSTIVESVNNGSMNDSNSFVIVGLLLSESELPEIESFFKDQKFIPETMNLTGAANIKGNVRESTGDYRHDVIFFTSGTGDLSPMARLLLSRMGVKWTSDFIDNYRSDYTLEDDEDEDDAIIGYCKRCGEPLYDGDHDEYCDCCYGDLFL